ncbi:MAG: methyltransferase domain-containing protein [Proteobacteria bacterium]|nr:methyltransferase domain-containing protein [Pseudomonadota bacterium]
MTDSITVFNRHAVRRHRDRAAIGAAGAADNDSDFLFRESAERLLDRLDDVTRSFPRVLEFGCRTGHMGRALRARRGIDTLVQCDLSEDMAKHALSETGGLALAADEEALPFGGAVFDLIIGNLSLHWVNDLPGALIQIRRALKPDGLFLAAMFGGETLIELRQSLAEAEIAEEDGLSPRVSPMAEVRDLGGLLQRAGLALPVVDSDTLTVMYPDPMALMADLRAMGETNAAVQSRKGFTRPATLTAAAARYAALFADGDGKIPATFQILTLTGWAPDASQQQPLTPGSATARLADALDTKEHPLPDKARLE